MRAVFTHLQFPWYWDEDRACFQSFFTFPGAEQLLESFAIIHVHAPGQVCFPSKEAYKEEWGLCTIRIVHCKPTVVVGVFPYFLPIMAAAESEKLIISKAGIHILLSKKVKTTKEPNIT